VDIQAHFPEVFFDKRSRFYFFERAFGVAVEMPPPLFHLFFQVRFHRISSHPMVLCNMFIARRAAGRAA
jgi:hypothetical protein